MKQTRIHITPIQRRVLANLAADPQVTPDTAEEFDAYIALRDIGLVDYNAVARAVTPTDVGYEVLKEVRK